MSKRSQVRELMGIQRDCADPRDHCFEWNSSRRCPDSVDLRSFVLRVENQGQTNACGAFTASSILEMLLRRDQPARAVELSAMFTWYNALALAGDAGKDEPVSTRNLAKALRKMGICAEKSWPFELERLRQPPAKDAYREGKRIRIRGYQRIVKRAPAATAHGIRVALSRGFPVFLGIWRRDYLFESMKGVPLAAQPARFERFREYKRLREIGHFMAIVGYQPEGALVLNSWGPEHGDQGYYLMPWKVVVNESFDIWVITGLQPQRRPRTAVAGVEPQRRGAPAVLSATDPRLPSGSSR